MGGTSIIFTSVAFGIILSVSRTVQPIKDPIANELEIETDEDNY
jgi:hypothetical protein